MCLLLLGWIRADLVHLTRVLSIQGFLLYQKTTKNSYLESEDRPTQPSSNMDRFERCFSIFRLKRNPGTTLIKPDTSPRSSSCTQSQSERHSHQESAEVRGNGSESRPKSWRAVRVDLVVSPISQFAFALLGWTGSKVSRDKPHLGTPLISLQGIQGDWCRKSFPY